MVVQRWHFRDGIRVIDKRREEQKRAISKRKRNLIM
jgi:hypothetical protein